MTDGASRDGADYKDQEGTGDEGACGIFDPLAQGGSEDSTEGHDKGDQACCGPALKVSKEELRAHVERLEKTVAALRIKNRELSRAAKVYTAAGAAKQPETAAKARKPGRSSVVADTPAENDASLET